jgi:hypothetical protein
MVVNHAPIWIESLFSIDPLPCDRREKIPRKSVEDLSASVTTQSSPFERARWFPVPTERFGAPPSFLRTSLSSPLEKDVAAARKGSTIKMSGWFSRAYNSAKGAVSASASGASASVRERAAGVLSRVAAVADDKVRWTRSRLTGRQSFEDAVSTRFKSLSALS